MMRILACVWVLLLGAAAAMADEGAVRLDALGGWSIVVADDATPSERYAAAEFQSLLGQLTGTTLPIEPPGHGNARHIFIGTGAAAAAGKLGFDTTGMGEEAFRIRIAKKAVVIAGGRPRGTLYGVYEFFERYCGVRFLTFDHTYFPEVGEQHFLPEADFTYSPPFSFRSSYYKENFDRPEFAVRLRVNTVTTEEKLGGSTRQSLINHTYAKWITPEKFGKAHPEYFALVDGARKCSGSAWDTEPCVSNPDVIRIITQCVLDEIAANPAMENISVSQNDNSAYCRCAECEDINQREGTPAAANLALVNAVAEAVEKKFPLVKVGTLAYSYTRTPPKTFGPRKNVQVQLCSAECCVLHPINDATCEMNHQFCADLQKWKAVTDNIWVWNYNTNFNYYDLPFPNLRAIGPNVLFFLASHAKGVFMQANGNGNSGEMCDLRNYVMARCLWDPTQDSWTLTEEFCRLHYREAAPFILDYLKLIHDNAEAKHVHPNCGAAPIELGLDLSIGRESMALFAKALAAATTDSVRARVEKASIPAYRTTILTNGRPWKVEGGVCKRDLPVEDKELVSTYVELCKKYNMSMVSEMLPATVYFERPQNVEAMPVVRIENDVWRLTVLPEENGKLIEMFHKPSGRHFLPAINHENILQGAVDEPAQVGFTSNAYTLFHAETKDNKIYLTRSLDDGSTVERWIGLNAAHPEIIEFESKLTHRGPEPKVYQFRVRPEFDAFAESTAPDVLGVYIKDSAWKRINRDWKDIDGPDQPILAAAKGGGFSYFNARTGAGVAISFPPESVKLPQLRWLPLFQQVNLELFTQVRELKPGESLDMAYQFRVLSEPPK
ncbi:MAG: DUF4838 domain-containing protein [Candidatus Hydrogenedentes bacterium]|nr:DUF4838 domain-containing protein [Candidatus Hydrogenedentota bacterium]